MLLQCEAAMPAFSLLVDLHEYLQHQREPHSDDFLTELGTFWFGFST
jgi:hypothetical protein